MNTLADELISAVTGKIFDYAGVSLPGGYLWANGQAISRATYSRLFSVMSLSVTGTTNSNTVITGLTTDLTQVDGTVVGWPISGAGIPAGTTISAVSSNTITLSQAATATAAITAIIAPYGIGDGSTTFNVPDCRGRIIAGRDNMGGVAAGRVTAGGSGLNGLQLGAAAGVETVAITVAQMPAHNHAVTDPGHTHNTNSNNYPLSNQGTGTLTPYNGAGAYTSSAAVISASTGITVGSNGSGTAHNNTQPSVIVHKIIKY